jgi:hypothetical protein
LSIQTILTSRPHNKHHLSRYIRFIQACSKEQIVSDYTEDHHICPKALDMFPEYASFKDHPWNRVVLTYRQHLIAHKMLHKAYGKSQTMALWSMLNIDAGNEMRVNSKFYETVRREFVSLISVKMKEVWSDPDWKAKRVVAMVSQTSSEEANRKKSEKRKQLWEDPSFVSVELERRRTPEQRAKKSVASKKLHEDPEWTAKEYERRKGKTHRDAISAGLRKKWLIENLQTGETFITDNLNQWYIDNDVTKMQFRYHKDVWRKSKID